jgi:DNA repair exonuclease SbcCD ATPase subunit
MEEKKLELEKIKSQYNKKQSELSNEIDTHKEKERKLSNQINEISNDVYYLESRKKRTESEIEDLKKELDATKEEEFDKSKTVCPTCKRELEKEKIDELLLNFQHQKENRLAEINSKVENQGNELQDIENRINTQKTDKEALEVKLESLKQVTFDDSEIKDLENKISQMQNEIKTLKAKEVESVVSNRIEELSEQYDECVRELTKQDLMIETKNKIQNLKNRSKELANLDKDRILKQDQLFEYIKEKIAIVNKTVNENFRGVQFIFFTPLTSNADKPYEITCTIAFEGVEYQKCSTGQKILANCRVFEGLEKLLDVDTFKFIDERQSTTLDLGIGGQVIELITSDDKSKCNFKPTQIKDIYTIEDTDRKNF